MLYGSFFTLNAENLFRGHRIPASSCLPELILAALSIDKAFSGAKYAAYVLQLSSLYFPADGLLGLVQPLSAVFFCVKCQRCLLQRRVRGGDTVDGCTLI